MANKKISEGILDIEYVDADALMRMIKKEGYIPAFYLDTNDVRFIESSGSLAVAAFEMGVALLQLISEAEENGKQLTVSMIDDPEIS